ncbi:hypothetical protein [Corynebacterium argentoratense]|uniref:hypothetical protein n=1 Tax=Corynebacterium argentoratense TaxID=42817 RepID=UPI0028F0E57E|nr:hypothetical protein [Corynebacterium argentoratense]
MRCATPRTPLMPATSGAAAAEAALEPLAVFCGLWGVLIVPVARNCSSTVGLAMVLDRLDAPPRTEPTPPTINPAALIAMVRAAPGLAKPVDNPQHVALGWGDSGEDGRQVNGVELVHRFAFGGLCGGRCSSRVVAAGTFLRCDFRDVLFVSGQHRVGLV